MGQKIHPGGMRVGVIHDWKSNWYTGKKEFPQYLLEDIKIREHIYEEAVARGPVRHPDPQGQAADHRRHLHRAPGDRDRQVRCRGGRAPQGPARADAQERPHQHQRDQAPGARREARRAVDRRAAAEPRLVPPRDEARARVGDPLRRAGDQDRLRRPPRRRRDEPLRELLRGPRAAAHDPRGHRLRLRRGEDDLRPHRRQGLDQQGRDHAGGLRRRLRPATSASATRIRRAAGAAARRRASAPRARAPAAAARTARASGRCASVAAARAEAAEPAVAGAVPAAHAVAAEAAIAHRARPTQTRRTPTDEAVVEPRGRAGGRDRRDRRGRHARGRSRANRGRES